VADFQEVAAWVFEKDGVVDFILPRWTFEVLCVGARNDPGKAIDFRGAFGPERNPVLVRHVAGRFGDAKKGGRSVVRRRSLVLGPVRNPRLA